MNAKSHPLSFVCLFLIGLCCLLAIAMPVFATETAVPTVQAASFMELIANRSRMIQVSLVFVAIGCSLLWWRR